MKSRKFLNIMLSFIFITSLVFGSVVQVGAQGSQRAAAMLASPTDEEKVPHYFGPNPNWALSPLRQADVAVDLTGGGGTGAAAQATVDPQTGAISAITISAERSSSIPTTDSGPTPCCRR